jgi:hypothetical protein
MADKVLGSPGWEREGTRRRAAQRIAASQGLNNHEYVLPAWDATKDEETPK